MALEHDAVEVHDFTLNYVPNVTVQALPTGTGAHAGLAGTFSVLSFGDLSEPDVVYIEHPLGGVRTEKAADVAKATHVFDRPRSIEQRSHALSPDDSRALIRQVAERYGDSPDRK